MIEQHPFKWRHFQADVILLCVRWYLHYTLSYRDLEELMLERGLHVIIPPLRGKMIITTSSMVHTFGSLSRLSRGILSVHVVGINEPKYSFVNELVVRILTIAEASLFLKAELFEQACGGEIGICNLSFNAMQMNVFEAELNNHGQGLCHDPFIPVVF
jgi:hypothetical protein